MFNEEFKHGKTFNVNADDFPFTTLDEVIAENGMDGKIYRYGNSYENGKPLWEEVGKTQGYA